MMLTLESIVGVKDMIAPKTEKCGEYHIFDIYRKKLGLRCRCGKHKGDFDYVRGFNLSMRVRIKTKTDFKGVN